MSVFEGIRTRFGQALGRALFLTCGMTAVVAVGPSQALAGPVSVIVTGTASGYDSLGTFGTAGTNYTNAAVALTISYDVDLYRAALSGEVVTPDVSLFNNGAGLSSVTLGATMGSNTVSHTNIGNTSFSQLFSCRPTGICDQGWFFQITSTGGPGGNGTGGLWFRFENAGPGTTPVSIANNTLSQSTLLAFLNAPMGGRPTYFFAFNQALNVQDEFSLTINGASAATSGTPEPGTMLTLGCGLVAVLATARRRFTK